jgi:signal transduction histidine kinase
VSNRPSARPASRGPGAAHPPPRVWPFADESARQLEAARLRGFAEMAPRLGHEISNTLAAILIRAEMLAMDTPVGAPGRESVEVIDTAVRQGILLTQRVRELARLARPLTPQPVDLPGVVEDALGALRERLDGGARGRVVTEHAASPPFSGDRAELALAVRHLVANALDAMPGGGRVRIVTGADAASVYCRIVDGGAGIAPDVEAHVFEPFFSTRGTPGGGLGLTVARAVAMRHGGDVELTRAPAGGTVATLRLPRPP